jgi:hypothetical protein
MSKLSNGTKKHTLKSRETIPLNKIYMKKQNQIMSNLMMDKIILYKINARNKSDATLK